MQTPPIHSDVAIIGGGFGAVAAAIALVERGYRVAMTEQFDWIGGQVASQGLCVLDDLDSPSGEEVGVSRRYASFRRRTREWYKHHLRLSPAGEAQIHLCAGNARCSHLTAEPNVAHACLLEWLRPAIESGQLQIFTNFIPISAERSGDAVASITCRHTKDPARLLTLSADFFLDGTEAGDTYPLLNLDYRLGSEGKDQFGEAHAAAHADRSTIHCFTYCAMVQFVPGGNFVGRKPADYESIRDRRGFYLAGTGATPEHPSLFFKSRPIEDRRIASFWHYRCVLDSANFVGVNSCAVINVGCNDYKDEAYLENPQADEVLARARNLTAAYVYWLQTEAPRDDGGRGYPELRLMPEATGTPDGIAQAPYVREGRRLVACQTIVEQDLSMASNSASRARHFADSVGLAAYAIDIHSRAGSGEPGVWQESRPYQIPLGAMLCGQLTNFAVAGKGIGVTQVANGAYRLHPAEWAIGEAAGELAAFCLGRKLRPPLVGGTLLEFQRRLLQVGIPIYWFEDLPFDHPAFEAAEILAIRQIWPGDAGHLRFDPNQSILQHRQIFEQILARLEAGGVPIADFREVCFTAHNARKYDVVHRLMKLLDERGWPGANT